jgi:hypothetical protein
MNAFKLQKFKSIGAGWSFEAIANFEHRRISDCQTQNNLVITWAVS